MKVSTEIKKGVDRGTGSWMITYGDMVTLLLTFFVLVLVILNEAENNIYRMVNYLLSETEERLVDYVKINNLDKSIQVERGTKGIKITISSQSLFDVNSASIKPGIRPVLYQIGKLIKSSRIFSTEEDIELEEFNRALEENGYKLAIEIRVEGHTDNWPIRSGKYRNNWELSSARALEVVKYLSGTTGIPEEMFFRFRIWRVSSCC